MKLTTAVVMSLALGTQAWAQTPAAVAPGSVSSVSVEDIQAVAPALSAYTQADVLSGLWQRPQLNLRDRSIVTVTALIATGQDEDLEHYLDIAFDNGVSAREISEIITHLAFYTGWPSAMAAIPAAKKVFADHGVGADQLPSASPQLLPLNEEAEAARAKRVGETVGIVSPGLDAYTTDPMFRNLWLRPDLKPRDRSLVTISALMARGQVAQLGGHLTRALDNGLTEEQAGEVITQIAFYAGWPNGFSAAPVFGEIFKSRPK